VLQGKKADAVGRAVVRIMSSCIIPEVLQSDNGSEFLGLCIQRINEYFPNVHVVKGRPRHPQSQGFIERGNGVFKEALRKWMVVHGTDWTIGAYIVNAQLNLARSVRRNGISPYTLYYGRPSPSGPQFYLEVAGRHAKTEYGLLLAKKFIKQAYTINPARSITVNELKAVVYAGDHIFEDTAVTELNLIQTLHNEVNALLDEFGISHETYTIGQSNGDSNAINLSRIQEEEDSSSNSQCKESCTRISLSTMRREKEEYSSESSSSKSEGAKWRMQSINERCPVRERLEKEASLYQEKFARLENKNRGSKVKQNLEVGDIVRILVEGTTRGGTDAPYLPAVVVRIRTYKSGGISYKLCTKVGYLKKRYLRNDLVHCPDVNAAVLQINPLIHKENEGLSITDASAKFNPLGGNGHCKCSGPCDENSRCACRRMGRFCTSRCHKHPGRGGNLNCVNCAPDNDDIITENIDDDEEEESHSS